MRQAIAELASSVDARRAYYAQLSSTAIDHDRKLEMVVKVGMGVRLINRSWKGVESDDWSS